MTADVEQLTERSTEDAARARAERIRAGIHNYLETLAEIALAWERRDWQVLGYADWPAYVDGEFGADRLRLPAEHRQRAVAELRLAGMSQRAIATAVGVDQATVQRDLARGDASASPAEVRGVDGKTYAPTRPAPASAQPSAAAGPDPGERVWIATARKGIAAHALKSREFTLCGRSTRTGLTLTALQSVERWEATWCRPCWPASETTRFAAGEAAPTGPANEAHDPRASWEAGAEVRGSAPAGTPVIETAAGVASTDPADGADTAFPHGAGDAAPAPAPSAASPAGGAGVTPAQSGLTLAQARRVRAALAHLNASGGARVEQRVYEVPYSSTSPTLGGPQPVTLASVQWWDDGEIHIRFLKAGGHYCVASTEFYAGDVDQALDVLCALRLLPAHLSTAYAAGVQAGMRGGEAIDGELVEVDRG